MFRCTIDKKVDHCSDHKPVTTVIGFQPQAPPEKNRRLFKKIDLEKFTTAVEFALPSTTEITSAPQLEAAADLIITALQFGVEASVPITRICVKSRPGFTGDTMEAIRVAKKASRKKNNSEADNIRYKKAKRERDKAIKTATQTE